MHYTLHLLVFMFLCGKCVISLSKDQSMTSIEVQGTCISDNDQHLFEVSGAEGCGVQDSTTDE